MCRGQFPAGKHCPASSFSGRGSHDPTRHITTAWPMRSASCRWMPSKRRIRAIPDCRWAPPTSPRCCSPAISNSTRSIRTGPTATASCCRPDTARCCFTRCCYLTGYEDMTIDQIENFRQLGSRTAGHPGIWPCHRHRDDDRPARPGLRQLGRHGARRAHPQRRIRRRPRRPPHLCAGRRRLPDGRHQPGGDRACRPSQAEQADRFLGQQQHLDRRSGVAGRLHRPGRRAFQASGWNTISHRRP